MARVWRPRRRGGGGGAGGRRALLPALLLLGGLAATLNLSLTADRLGWLRARSHVRLERGRKFSGVARQVKAEGAETSPPKMGIFGVQQEEGDGKDPSERGPTGQLSEAIETGIREQGGGPRLRETNAIIFPSERSREGGVYVQDFSTKGPGNKPVCNLTKDVLCEVAPDLFSRAGLVLRKSEDQQPGVERNATSLETQHTCVCLDKACQQIAELRVVDVYEGEDALAKWEPREHACVLRRQKGRETFTGCAQSLLVAEPVGFGNLNESIVNSREFKKLGLKNGKFPRTVKTWQFEYERDDSADEDLNWRADGYRGYVNVMMAEEYDALRKVNLSQSDWKVDFDVLDSQLSKDETEWLALQDANASKLCAETANWALHAAAHQATTLDDVGRGVVDSTFVEVLPPRASGTELALSIGQALLGLATLYLLLADVLLEMTKMQDAKEREIVSGGRVDLLPGVGRGRGLRRRRRRMTELICRWPVWMAYAAGLVLLGLEMIALIVVWFAERGAVKKVGQFVHASFVAAIASDTGDAPLDINESGNVIVVTVVVGTAGYTKSSVTPLSVAFPICLVLGAAAIVLAICPVLVWRRFSMHEMSKVQNDAGANAAVSFNESGADTLVTAEQSPEDSAVATSLSTGAPPLPPTSSLRPRHRATSYDMLPPVSAS